MRPVSLLRLTLVTLVISLALVLVSKAAGTNHTAPWVSFARLTDPATLTERPFLLDLRLRVVVPDLTVPPGALWWSYSPTGDYLLTLRLVNEVQVEATFHDLTTDTRTVYVLPGAVLSFGGGDGVGTFYHDWHPTDPLVAYVHYPVSANVVRGISPEGVVALGALAPDQLIEAVRWSPDGTRIAALHSPDLYVLDATQGDTFRRVDTLVPDEEQPGYKTALYGWGAAGDTVWVYEQYISARECVLGVNLTTGEAQQTYCQQFLQPWSLRFAAYHPPTDTFAFEQINENTFRNRLSLLTDDDKAPTVFRIESFWDRFAFSFAPDGARLLVMSVGRGGGETLYLLDPSTGELDRLTDGFDGRWVLR
jgi:hypothetical protein